MKKTFVTLATAAVLFAAAAPAFASENASLAPEVLAALQAADATTVSDASVPNPAEYTNSVPTVTPIEGSQPETVVNERNRYDYELPTAFEGSQYADTTKLAGKELTVSPNQTHQYVNLFTDAKSAKEYAERRELKEANIKHYTYMGVEFWYVEETTTSIDAVKAAAKLAYDGLPASAKKSTTSAASSAKASAAASKAASAAKSASAGSKTLPKTSAAK